MIKRTGLHCEDCGYELLTEDELNVVFCQNCKTKDGKFKRVQPNAR